MSFEDVFANALTRQPVHCSPWGDRITIDGVEVVIVSITADHNTIAITTRPVTEAD